MLSTLSSSLIFLAFFLMLATLISSVSRASSGLSLVVYVYRFLKSSVGPNLQYSTFTDILLSFFFFFVTLYFSELHFFFVFSAGLSSDGFSYQFNFILSSFFFIFVTKTLRSLFTDETLFSVSSFLSLTQQSSSSARATLNTGSKSGLATARKKLSYAFTASYSVKLVVLTLFFVSTFLVWLLRYVIQFIRLLVLYMIHMVFEQVIVYNDSVLSMSTPFNFFFFKYVFLVFLLFWGFLYLLVYLNLMFTLQTFIFFFFSEVFQSNFLSDLSALSSKKVYKL